MRLKSSAAILCLAAIGCVPAQKLPMTEQVGQSIQGQKIICMSRKKPDFAAMTAGKASFGAIGGSAMIAAGNKIVEEHKVEDPAVKISAGLLAKLQEKYNLSVVAYTPGPVETDNIDALADFHPKEDLLLNVQTVNWSFAYFPTNWNHYRVIYSIKASLVDLRHRKVIAEGFASRVEEESPSSPTYDELMADDAARLKAKLGELSDACYQELLKDTFKL